MCLFTNCAFHKDRDNDFVLFAFVCFSQCRASLCGLLAGSGGGSTRRERGQERGIISSFNKKLVLITAKIS